MMNCERVGQLILKMRKEKGITQKQLADSMGISDKAVSKWERGLGCPDVSLLPELSAAIGINIEGILSGDLSPNDIVGGNMKNIEYYVCTECGNIITSTATANVSCCGRRLEALAAHKANEDEKLNVQSVEDEWFITSDHPMVKEHYISFVAFATSEKLQIVKQYPEWNLQLRIPRRGHGKLFWYCTQQGLFYQLI